MVTKDRDDYDGLRYRVLREFACMANIDIDIDIDTRWSVDEGFRNAIARRLSRIQN
jgi:hypothetical protein